MHHRTLARAVAITGILAASAALAACSSPSSAAGGGGSSAPSAAAGAVDLSGVCPATVVVQTDWNPEAEHGHLYELLGSDYTIDASNKSVSGPLMAAGQPTGVNIEIRAGGPAIGFQTVSSQMYQDKDITLGYVATDEAIQLSNTTPTTAVFAPLDVSPTMVMWDPTSYPNVSSIKDVKSALQATGGVWRYFDGSAYMEYLKSAGFIDAANLDGSYDGTPANFVAGGGKDMQQGFASSEPYIYENEVSAWDKPVKFDLIANAGWAPYQSSMSVRSGELQSLTPCLQKLVPVLQQAEVDYYADPSAATALILKLVDAYNNGWVYSQGVADYANKTVIDLGLVGNGTNGSIGDFDTARVADLLSKAIPIYTQMGSAPKSGLTADDLVTNAFIDSSIGLSK